jgi:hypothetical protein
MGAIQDEMALADQEKLDQQAAAASGQQFNKDGSGVANDYHSPTVPQSTAFPAGLAGQAGGHLRVNRDTLTSVAGQMKADLGGLASSVTGLNGGGAGGATIAGWTTADGMGNNAGQAYYGISTFMQDLHDCYDQTIGYLHQTVTNYADAEATTAAAANNVGAGA